MERSSFIKKLIEDVEKEKELALKSQKYTPTQSKPFTIGYQTSSAVVTIKHGRFLGMILSRIQGNRYSNYLLRWITSLIKLPKLCDQLFSRISGLEVLTKDLEKRIKSTNGVENGTIARLDARITQITNAKATSSSSQLLLINDDMNLDEYYFHFENRFRGSRERIIEEMKTYLAKVQATEINFAENPILDIGCGRGEWLAVLKSAGVNSAGIDINTKMVDFCLKEGLTASVADAISHLRSLPPKSLGGITAFQVVEHLPFESLIDVFKECKRVLIPDGFVIFETPNPENYRVGACDFYYDMTHINPIPPAALGFLLGNIGFIQMETIRTQPVEEYADQLDAITNSALKQLASQFYGPRNYAIFGTMQAYTSTN